MLRRNAFQTRTSRCDVTSLGWQSGRKYVVRIPSRRFASTATKGLSSSRYSSKRPLTNWCPRKMARGRTNDPKGEPADHSRRSFAKKRRWDVGMTRGESEKKRFAFPRTKHSLAPLVLSTVPSSSSRSRTLFSMRSSFSSIFFPTPFSSAPFPSLSLRAVQLFVVFSHLFSFLLSLSFSLFCWSYSSSSCFIAMCSLPRKLVHSSSSLACSPFLPSLFPLSLYSSCQLIKPVDLPSHLSPFVIEIYEPACSRSPFQSIYFGVREVSLLRSKTWF